ncbi:hypothetical protein GWK47_030039 [Chionoecetes opilio]|uniref:Uncharacterized protein n=1 Tax=Chionoecetes opilio TaxID=41210 RepID=A0A8J5D2R3_CHIOP|nr:hypothetical protein GWK47_030039 [Chionoecetes opilio]
MSGHDKIFESGSQQQAERAARLRAERGTRYEFVTKFLQFFSCQQRRTAADVSTWAAPKPTVKGMQRTWLPTTSSWMFTSPRHCDSHISQEGHGVVDICSTADRLGLSDNQVTALVSATLKAGGADLGQVCHLNLNNETEQDAGQGTKISQEYMAAFSEDPPKYALSTGMAKC